MVVVLEERETDTAGHGRRVGPAELP